MIRPGRCRMEPHEREEIADLREWLQKQAQTLDNKETWLLAHADDGVIWGKIEAGALMTSTDAEKEAVDRYPEVRGCSPELRRETLQTARLFGENAELLLWRDEEGFRWRVLQDLPDETGEGASDGGDAIRLDAGSLDESQVLWGTKAVPLQNGFTLMVEGEQGLLHVVPYNLPPGEFRHEEREMNRPLRLKVRHYATQDEETGFTRITASRLVGLFTDLNV